MGGRGVRVFLGAGEIGRLEDEGTEGLREVVAGKEVQK